MKRDPVIAALAALAAGLAHWFAARALQAALAWALGTPVMPLNAGIEEGLRLAVVVLGYASSARLGLDGRSGYAWALLASWAFGSMENMSYLLAYPSWDLFWRLGYSLPVHVNAGMLYALALAPRRVAGSAGPGGVASPAAGPALSAGGSRALRAAPAVLALGAGWAWHTAFNAAAGLGQAWVPAAGSALNTIVFLALLALAERRLILEGVFHGYDRTR